jgi:hypothetical protein
MKSCLLGNPLGIALSSLTLLAAAIAIPKPALAATFNCNSGCTQNGLTFSAASEDFDITQVTGDGTLSNPFVVYQAVRGLDIVLGIQGLRSNRILGTRPGFALSIVAHNLTGTPWRFYDHELQETLGTASSENDGLSFAQGQARFRPFISSHHAGVDEVTDARDYLNFAGGLVQPNGIVRFDYVVTDTIPNDIFYIRQRPDFKTGQPPTPPTLPTLAVEPVSPTVTLTPENPPSSTPTAVPEPMSNNGLLFSGVMALGGMRRIWGRWAAGGRPKDNGKAD